MLPNFIIAGAAKSGSSALLHYLAQHPDVLASREKEPAYFTTHWQSKPLAWYESFFAGWAGERAVGEATVEYMVDVKAPERIRATLPDVRLLFILRDPVERAWSHYWHRVKMGEETREFDRIVRELSVAEYPLRYGMYATQLRRYLNEFDRHQIRCVITEEFASDMASVMASVFSFLELDASFEVSYEGRINVAKLPRFRRLNNLLGRLRRDKRIRGMIPDSLAPLTRRVFRGLRSLNWRRAALPPLTKEHRLLLQDFYADEVEGLEHLLGRDLKIWKDRWF